MSLRQTQVCDTSLRMRLFCLHLELPAYTWFFGIHLVWEACFVSGRGLFCLQWELSALN